MDKTGLAVDVRRMTAKHQVSSCLWQQRLHQKVVNQSSLMPVSFNLSELLSAPGQYWTCRLKVFCCAAGRYAISTENDLLNDIGIVQAGYNEISPLCSRCYSLADSAFGPGFEGCLLRCPIEQNVSFLFNQASNSRPHDAVPMTANFHINCRLIR